MKLINRWPKNTISISLVGLGIVGLTAPCFAANPNQFQDIQSSASERILQPNQGEYLVAQVSPSCRRVVNRNGLDVRLQPTTSSTAVGMVNYGRNVSIESRGINGWVPISVPLQGYVNANSLGACNIPISVPTTNCRSVVGSRGINVRPTPSNQGRSVGFVPTGRRVMVENLGANGWVPIIAPLKGYVQSTNLAYCL